MIAYGLETVDLNFFKSKIRLLLCACCTTIIVASLVIVGWAAIGEHGGRTPYGTPDYAGFYTAATILNRGWTARLYDPELQAALLHELLPDMKAGEQYPFAHAPFVAFLLRPMAGLPFHWSYSIWLVVVAVIALAGLRIILLAATGIPPRDRTTTLLVAVTFLPLIQECWLAGQLSIVGFFWVAVAFRELRLGRMFRCGVGLAMCLYKPTLLLFAVPVLILGAQRKLLAGFAAGTAGLAIFSLTAVGFSGCRSYLDMLTTYARHTSAGSPGFKLFKHVDLNSFGFLLLGRPGPLPQCTFLLLVAAAVFLLVRAWWSLSGRGDDNRILALCATLTWNSVFNLYTPIYDLTLVIPNVLMTADVHLRRPKDPTHPLGPVFAGLVALLVLGTWVTQQLAQDYGVQPVTLVLLALGAYQAILASRDLPSEEVSPCE